MGIISEIARLEKECFSDAWSHEALEDTFKYEHNHLLAVFDDGSCVSDYVFQGSENLAGYIIFSEVLGDAELLRIAVASEKRRKGFGGRLMEELIRELEFMNAERVSLEVRAGNEAALALYTIYGFERQAIRRNYYMNPDEDAVIMQRPIAKNEDELEIE